jgi:type I restriction enzyme R subunit
MPETPEQKARREIDADLTAAGWLVQDRDELDLSAGRGIAVREYTLARGWGKGASPASRINESQKSELTF